MFPSRDKAENAKRVRYLLFSFYQDAFADLLVNSQVPPELGGMNLGEGDPRCAQLPLACCLMSWALQNIQKINTLTKYVFLAH